jgi:hypothetical protein
MKITLFRVLALAGALAAATENVESPHVRRRALEESDAATRATTDAPPGLRDLARLRKKKPGRKPPAAIQSMEGNEYDMDPPGRTIELVVDLDDKDSGTTADDPPGMRDLVRLRRKKPGRKPPAAIQSMEGNDNGMVPPETTADGPRDLAKLRKKKPGRKPPAAIQSMEGDGNGMVPPETTEDGSPGGRDLAKLRRKKPGRKPPAAIQSREGSEYGLEKLDEMIEVVGDDEDSEATEDGRPPGWRE